jgi:hypothetical protein
LRLGFCLLSRLAGGCRAVGGCWRRPEQGAQSFQRDTHPRAARGFVEHAISSQQLQRLLHWRVLQCAIRSFTPASQIALQPIRCRAVVAATILLCAQNLAKFDDLIFAFQHDTIA